MWPNVKIEGRAAFGASLSNAVLGIQHLKQLSGHLFGKLAVQLKPSTIAAALAVT